MRAAAVWDTMCARRQLHMGRVALREDGIMALDRAAIDRWIVGEAWVGSELETHLEELCDRIGPRVSSSEGERRAAEYIRDRMAGDGLEGAPLGEIDYVQIVDPDDLTDVQNTDGPVVIALAVHFGSTRLIDNMRVDAPA